MMDMNKLQVSAFDIAQRYSGISGFSGMADNPVVLAMLKLDADWVEHDEVPWCSAFVNWICWHLRLPRSKSLAARSWLGIGRPVALWDARAENDVVILWRVKRDGWQGHVGFYAGHDADNVYILGGNQSNRVCVDSYPLDNLLGINRLT